jgi:hypothetical protein
MIFECIAILFGGEEGGGSEMNQGPHGASARAREKRKSFEQSVGCCFQLFFNYRELFVKLEKGNQFSLHLLLEDTNNLSKGDCFLVLVDPCSQSLSSDHGKQRTHGRA